MTNLPVAIIGGGPVGLAAAAHLLERGEQPLLFEAGDRIGANILDWAHVRMFSPWEFNLDSACVRLLKAAGWTMPPADQLPTGAELVSEYLQPLADLPALRALIHTGTRVTAVSRSQRDKVKEAGRAAAPFQLRLQTRDGAESSIEARAVIDASGTWHKLNPLGANGLPALGETALNGRIAYGIPDVLGHDRARYAGARVMVVGSGHSAINTLLDLIQLRSEQPATQVVWVMRGDNLQKVYGGGEADALAARGALGLRVKAAVEAGALEIIAPFALERVEARGAGYRVGGDRRGAPHSASADEIIVATGARPELEMLRELRLDLDPAIESARVLAPLIDPNLHSCGTVAPHGEAELRQPEKDFYIVGMKSYGRAPSFLLATGYEQARSVAAALCGDWAAARDVQLNLPATGVCVTDYASTEICCEPAGLVAIGEIPLTTIAGRERCC